MKNSFCLVCLGGVIGKLLAPPWNKCSPKGCISGTSMVFLEVSERYGNRGLLVYPCSFSLGPGINLKKDILGCQYHIGIPQVSLIQENMMNNIPHCVTIG